MVIYVYFGSLLLASLLCGWNARRKGYSFLCWVFAMGIFGIVVGSVLPDAEDNKRQAMIGNIIGLVMSGITIAGLIFCIPTL